MTGLVTADRVLQKGVGQCEHCGAKVITVLVDMPERKRQWWPVHRAAPDYRVHECKAYTAIPGGRMNYADDEPMRRVVHGSKHRLSTRPAPRGA